MSRFSFPSSSASARWRGAGGGVASSTGCRVRLGQGGSDLLTPWATRCRIFLSIPRCPPFLLPSKVGTRVKRLEDSLENSRQVHSSRAYPASRSHVWPKIVTVIDKTRMIHDSIFISWISSSVAPTRTAQSSIHSSKAVFIFYMLKRLCR